MNYIKDLKKIFAIITSSERRKLLSLFVLMIIGMVFETFGIAIIVPFVGIIADSNMMDKYPQLSPLLEKLGNPDQTNLVIIALFTLVVFYIIKNIFLIFLSWKQSKFSSITLANLSARMFDLYLHQPYSFHLQHNSAQLIRNSINEIGAFGIYGLSAILLLMTELFVLIGILTLLMIMEPIGTIAAILIMGFIIGTYYFFTKKHIYKWGKARQVHEGMRLKHIQQGLSGAKVVKLTGKEKYFLKLFKYHTYKGNHVGQRQSFISQIPKYIVEVVAVIGLAALIIIIVIQDNSTKNIIPLISLFAMATFRLMPSVNRIILSIQNLKYGIPVISLLHQELMMEISEEQKETQNIKFKRTLELKNINYNYPNTQSNSLTNITLTINKGETVGFIGESGAGKSTVADVILGLLTPSKGQILVDGINIHDNIRSWQKQIGYVPQSIYLIDDTLRRNIAFGLKDDEIDDENIWKVLKIAQLDDFISKSEYGLETKIGERGVRLSGGQQQRIGIARALYHNPDLLIFDEATSALDTETEIKFMQTIESLQGIQTIIIIAHRLSTVKNCDRIYKISNGEIINMGSAKEILS